MWWFSLLLINLWKIEFFDGKILKVENIKLSKNYLILDGAKYEKNLVKKILWIEKRKVKKDLNKYLELKSIDEIFAMKDSALSRWKDYPLIVLFDYGRIVFNKDSTRTYIYHVIKLINKADALKEAVFSEFIEEEEEKFELLFARVIKKDGSVIELSEKDLKITQAPQGAVFFGREKVYTLSFPKVEVGDIIEYAYKIHRFNPWNKKIFEYNWYFQSFKPYLLSKLIVDFPKDMFVKYKIYNDKEKKIKFRETLKKERHIMVWWAKNIDPIISEPLMAPYSDVALKIKITNLKNWFPVYRWYANFQKPRIEPTPLIKKKALEIIKGARTEEEKVAKLYHWVQQNIRYISIKGAAASGVSGHYAEETLLKGYGDCTDVSMLLCAFVKAIGLKAYPVYISVNYSGQEDPEMPGYLGNHCITQIEFSNGKRIFLDPTASTYRYPYFRTDDHGVWALIAMRETLEIIPVPPPEWNARFYKYKIKVDKNGNIYVKEQGKYTGGIEAGIRYYWLRKSQDEIPKEMERIAKLDYPNAKLVSYKLEPDNLQNLEKQLIFNMEYQVPSPIVKMHKNKFYLNFPFVESKLDFWREISLDKRKYPIFYLSSYEVDFDIEIESEIKIWDFPKEVDFKNKYADFTLRVKKLNDKKIILTYKFRRYKVMIPPEDYNDYRKFLKKVMNAVKQVIVFEK